MVKNTLSQKIGFVLVMWLFLGVLNVQAQGYYLHLPETNTPFNYNITPHLRIIKHSHDPDQAFFPAFSITYKSLGSLPTLKQSMLREGATKSDFWLVFGVANDTDNERTFYLTISNVLLHKIHLYQSQLTDDGKYSVLTNKDRIPQRRDGSYRQATIFEIHVGAHSRHNFIMNIKGEKAFSSYFRLTDRQSLFEQEYFDGVFITLSLTLFAVLTLYFFYRYSLNKHKISLLAASYTLSAASIILFWYGALAPLMSFPAATQAYMANASILMTMLTMVFLPLVFTWSHTQQQQVQRLTLSMLAVQIFFIAVALSDMDKYYRWALFVSLINAAGLAGIFWYYKSQYKKAKYVLAANLTITNLLTWYSFFGSQYPTILPYFAPVAVIVLPILAIFGLFRAEYLITGQSIEQQMVEQYKPDMLWKQAEPTVTGLLNNILSITEVLMRSPLSDAQRNYVRTLEQAAHHIDTSFGQLSDMAHMLSKQFELSRQPANTYDVITRCIREAQYDASIKAVTLATDISDINYSTQRMDTHAISAIMGYFLKLLLNNMEKGTLNVHASLYDLHRKNGLLIRFQGQASLINIDRLTGKLRTVTAKRALPRSISLEEQWIKNLLKISRTSLQINNGSESQVTFSLYLPCETEFNMYPSYERPESASLEGAHALIISENTLLRETLAYTMTSWGMSVDQSYKLQDAAALLRHKHATESAHQFIVIDGDKNTEMAYSKLIKRIEKEDLSPQSSVIWLTDHQQVLATLIPTMTILTKPVRYQDLLTTLLTSQEHHYSDSANT